MFLPYEKNKDSTVSNIFPFPLKPPVVWGKSNLIKPPSDVYSSKKKKGKTSEKFTRTLKQTGGMFFSVTFVMSTSHFYMSSDQLAKRRPISEQTEPERLHHLTRITPFQTLPSNFHFFEPKWDIKDVRLRAKKCCWKKWWSKKKRLIK